MTDAVTVTNGRAEMAFRGETPWHGLGNDLKDDMTLEEKVAAAGFGWTIERGEVKFTVGGGKGSPPKTFKMPGREVLYRSDNNEPLSVVSSGFKIVQPRHVLEYFEQLTERLGLGALETAGTLNGGKQFWGLANLGDMALSVKDTADRVKPYILFATSCDRSIANTIKFLSMRVVCWNTLSIGLREKGGTEYKSRHRVEFNAEKVNKALGLQAKEEFAEQMEGFRRLAETPMTDVEMIKASMILHASATPSMMVEEISKEDLTALAKAKQVKNISQLAIGHDAIGAALQGVQGTAWGWMNSVTEYIDWDNGSEKADRRLYRAWLKRGDQSKTRAFELAMDIADDAKPNLIRKAWKLSDDELRELALATKG